MYLTHFGDCFSKVLYLEGDVNSCYAIVIPDATKINFLELMSKLNAIYVWNETTDIAVNNAVFSY